MIRRHSAALSTLEELANSPQVGMDGFQAIGHALRHLFPVNAVVLFLYNADGDVTGYLGDEVFNDDVLYRYLAEFNGTPGAEALGPSHQAMLHRRMPYSTTFGERGYHRSALFETLLGPAGTEEIDRVFLWKGRLPAGGIGLGRPFGERPFREKELSALMGVRKLCERIIERFTSPVTSAPARLAEEVIWVADLNGFTELASPGAFLLARRAFGPHGLLPRMSCLVSSWLVQAFRELGSRLATGRPPILDQVNPFGRFQWRASWLAPHERQGQRRVLIQLTQHVPIRTRLFLSGRFRALPRREKQTVLALVDGCSTQEIAQQLRVSAVTALSWVRSLYLRFDVNRRTDLLAHLLQDAEPPVALSPTRVAELDEPCRCVKHHRPSGRGVGLLTRSRQLSRRRASRH